MSITEAELAERRAAGRPNVGWIDGGDGHFYGESGAGDFPSDDLAFSPEFEAYAAQLEAGSLVITNLLAAVRQKLGI